MFYIPGSRIEFSYRDWIDERIRRHALRSKMRRELNDLRSLSDEHLRDIGLYRSEIERYVLDLYSQELGGGREAYARRRA